MTRWEYMIWYVEESLTGDARVREIDGERVQRDKGSFFDDLAEAGAEGWELVTVQNGGFMFKRPV